MPHRNDPLRLKDSLVQLARSADISIINKQLWQSAEYDFAVNCGGIVKLIEYDGYQHFHPLIESEQLSRSMAVANFNATKINDAIKSIWCEKHNIELLRIPYWQYRTIASVLAKWFGDL